MATVDTAEKFALACGWLVDNGQLPVQGARFIDAPARKVYDERVGSNVDITPNTVTLEAALDSANAQLTTAQTQAIARTLLLSDAKNYLSNQLQTASPNVTNIYNTVKAYIDGNATLTQMLMNQISLFQTAYGVTINLASPTAADRTRYLICCQLVLATIA